MDLGRNGIVKPLGPGQWLIGLERTDDATIGNAPSATPIQEVSEFLAKGSEFSQLAVHLHEVDPCQRIDYRAIAIGLVREVQ
jgi:hypothetical protein